MFMSLSFQLPNEVQYNLTSLAVDGLIEEFAVIAGFKV
jgi:hypothetical protein